MNIEPFKPNQIDVINHLMSTDSLFRGLKKDEEQHRLQLIGIKNVMKKLRAKNSLQVQVANGLFENVTPSLRKEIIDNTSKKFKEFDDAYKGIQEQVKHRGDDVGDSRMRVFKLLYNVLKSQHNFKHEELIEFLIDRPEQMFRDDLDDEISKSLEADKSG